jgi:hypothetical protein
VAFRLTLAVLLLAAGARGVELHLQFGALERMLGDQLFTQDGRRYVRGSTSTRCNFAYLEKPHVASAGGLLVIRARFTGSSKSNLLGQCVGLGDAFDLTITAAPQYSGGNLGLRDVKVASDSKTGFYIRRVCTVMAASLARDFRYPLDPAAQKLLEDPGAQPGYHRELRHFKVSEIRVTEDALVLVLDFVLTVK